MTNSAVKALGTMFDALQNGDVEGWKAIVAEDATLYVPYGLPGMQAVFEGRDSFEALTWDFFRSWTHFEWLSLDLHAIADDPDLVFGTGRSKASNDKISYGNEYVFKARARDGRIVEYYEYFNPLNVMKSFGQTYP